MFVISQERGYKKLKEGVTLEQYRTKYPSAYECKKAPSIQTLERWDSEGYCKTPCGCKTEPDGTCPHGKESWLRILRLI